MLDLSGVSEEFSFNALVREPLQEIYRAGHTETIVLVIDALDEALAYTGSLRIPDLLSKLEDLPTQVRILATTRPDPRVLKFYRDVKPFDLINDAPNDNTDVAKSVIGRLAGLEPARREAQALAAAEDSCTTTVFSEAEAVARAIPGAYWRALALRDPAEALAQTGHFGQAAAVASAILDAWRYAATLSAWAQALVRQGSLGSHYEAVGTAYSIPDPRCLCRVRGGDANHSRYLLAGDHPAF